MAGGMKELTARKRLIVCLASAVVVVVLMCWYAGSTAPGIRIRFMSVTKEGFVVPGAYPATIQLENNLETPVVIRQVFVEERKDDRWLPPRAVVFADPPVTMGGHAIVPAFPALSTNTFACGIPTEPGPYRLHVSCFSDRNVPKGPALALRYRLANFIFWLAPPWGSGAKPVNVGLWRLVCRIQGGRCVTSEVFKPVALEDLLQQAGAGLVVTGAPGVNGPGGAGGRVEARSR